MSEMTKTPAPSEVIEGRAWPAGGEPMGPYERVELHGHEVPFDFDRSHALSTAAVFQLSRRVRLSGTWQLASGFPITTSPSPDDRMASTSVAAVCESATM